MSAKENNVVELKKKDNPYLITLSKSYDFEGKKIQELDLSPMEDMTSEAFFEASSRFAKEAYINPRPEADPIFCCMIAGSASGVPHEFFAELSMKDAKKVRNCVQDFFQDED